MGHKRGGVGRDPPLADGYRCRLPAGRGDERDAALVLSDAVGGLRLAHEQAAAYCERLDVSLSDYRRRLEAAPGHLLDDARDAPAESHDGLTAAKSFASDVASPGDVRNRHRRRQRRHGEIRGSSTAQPPVLECSPVKRHVSSLHQPNATFR
jgi:hypothetical protein